MDTSKIPADFDRMVFSVPHSGTTSLVNHLGLYMGGSKSGFRHFGQIHAYHQDAIDSYRGQANIPVRDPIAVALSWDHRYPDDEAWDWDALRGSLEEMIAYDRAGTVYWKTEDLPLNKAKGAHHNVRAIQLEEQDPAIFCGPRVQRLVEWYTDNPDAQGFYKQFYDGFWWE